MNRDSTLPNVLALLLVDGVVENVIYEGALNQSSLPLVLVIEQDTQGLSDPDSVVEVEHNGETITAVCSIWCPTVKNSIDGLISPRDVLKMHFNGSSALTIR